VVIVESRNANAKMLVIPAATYAVPMASRASAAPVPNVTIVLCSGLDALPSIAVKGCQPNAIVPTASETSGTSTTAIRDSTSATTSFEAR
jgi:hypothetical protein